MDDNKVRIGGQSDMAARATDAEQNAINATAEVTMIQRRIRTFYMALSEVSFPEGAPEWASEWKEWLLTGQVPVIEPEMVEAPPAATEEDVVEMPPEPTEPVDEPVPEDEL